MVGTTFTKYWYIPAPWDSRSSAFRIPSNGFTIPLSLNIKVIDFFTRKFFSKGKSVHCVAHVKIKVFVRLEVVYVHVVLLETFSRCKVEISSNLSNFYFLTKEKWILTLFTSKYPYTWHPSPACCCNFSVKPSLMHCSIPSGLLKAHPFFL